jgi:hypothetical protein
MKDLEGQEWFSEGQGWSGRASWRVYEDPGGSGRVQESTRGFGRVRVYLGGFWRVFYWSRVWEGPAGF